MKRGCAAQISAMDAGVGMSRPFRKITLDVDGVEAPPPTSKVFERQRMASGAPRLLISVPHDMPDLFRDLAARLAGPLFVLYVLHTPRGEGSAGRYQSPPLDSAQVDEFLADFTSYLASDARHDTWVHSASDGRTLIWDRHDLMFAEGEPLDEIAARLEALGFQPGPVPRIGAGPHIHHYRDEFDADAATLLARFDWTQSDLRPEDEQ
jgi:hypothetical protein